ncbi:MAG: hypothetical protein DCC56_09105 [Anaerolineae bacterium]|nr:MAG: hypothetical protein DCC56_09105 [Anaerolineae bacterium]WKZ45250.1 MAG: hypothetical protein QY302_05620 [Anaerolineales bacterium]
MNRIFINAMFALSIFLLTSCIPRGIGDCLWSAPILTWIDANENGVWDEGELPVEGVKFQVNDTQNNINDVGDIAVSDWEGKAQAFVWLPGCPSAKFEVLAFPPDGYDFVSNQVVEIHGSGYGSEEPILFPLALKPGFSIPTAYAPKLECKTYPLGAEEFKIAPDGSVWAVTWDNGALYEHERDTWKTIPFNHDLMTLPENIDIGSDGDVWIRSWNGIGQLQNDEWVIHSMEDSFGDNIVSSINYLDERGLWFAVPAPPDMFANFDPVTSKWSLYGPENRAGNIELRVTLMKGESTWFAIFENALNTAPLSNAPYPNWTTQNTHTFTSEDFEVIPLGGWIEDIEIDTRGKLWIAHSFGVSSFYPPDDEWVNFNPSEVFEFLSAPTDIAVGPDNTIWVIYSALHPYLLNLDFTGTDTSQPFWTLFDSRDGFPDDQSISSLIIDRDKNIWIGYGLSDLSAQCKYLQ